MSMPKRGLGRGLDALIPSSSAFEGPAQTPSGSAAGGDSIRLVPTTHIRRNPRQPRTKFDADALKELAASVREHGVLQPLIVTQGETGDTYILIAGERRLEASKLAELAEVPVIIREASDQQRLELALIENIQRADLGPIETALAYQHLAQDFDLSHEAIAERVGKSRVSVTNTLRLLRLPAKLQDALSGGVLSEGHARALLQLATPDAMEAAYDKVIANLLTVRQTEDLVRQMQGERITRERARPSDPDANAVAYRLQAALGFKVELRHGRAGRGAIVIHYYNDEDLNTLIDKLGGQPE
jgi:ParB family chromosome partitioning protein